MLEPVFPLNEQKNLEEKKNAGESCNQHFNPCPRNNHQII